MQSSFHQEYQTLLWFIQIFWYTFPTTFFLPNFPFLMFSLLSYPDWKNVYSGRVFPKLCSIILEILADSQDIVQEFYTGKIGKRLVEDLQREGKHQNLVNILLIKIREKLEET